MSIFTKDCPVCAATHPIHAVRCGCGYCFDPNKLDGVTQELEVIAQEERLYSDYLAARADQADKAWRSAKVTSKMDPGNTVKAAEALLAEQAALTTRAELDAQNARSQAVSARIKVVRSNRRSKRIAKASSSAPRQAPTSVRAAFAPPTPKPQPPPPIAQPKAETPKPVKPIIQAAPTPKPVHSAPKPAPVQTHTPKPHLVSPAPVPIARPAAVSAPAPKPAPAAVAKAAPAPAVSRSAITTPMEAAPAPAKPVAAPTIQRDPTPAFRVTQATKAERATTTPAANAPNAQECANCGAKVALNVKRCRCGFEMPLSASQIPSLSMNAEDRAALLAALAPLGTDKT